jgi:hypothetical protein
MIDHRFFHIRHAEHEYRIRQSGKFAHYPLVQGPSTRCRVLTAMGRWMVRWGMALQSRYGSPAQPWQQQQMTEQQWERAL